MKKIVPFILAFAAALPCMTVAANRAEPDFILNGMEPEYYIMLNSVNTDSQELLLGSLSAKYESNGKPETISAGNDTGGVSYGAYQFSSVYGVPMEFVNWCITSGEGADTGERLLLAYRLDGNTYGEFFNAEWKRIADENATAFLILQHNFTKTKFYDVMVAKLEAKVHGFKADNYTVALKNVIWSRAVQQGVNSDVIFKAIENLGGFKYQAEDVLIKAIYAQSSLLVDTPPYADSVKIEESSAKKYGVDSKTVTGKYLYYYSRNSSDIQVSVYRRLAVNELSDALKMYEKYKSDNPLLPSDPDTTKPVEPGTTVPVEPGTTKPVEPGTTLPVEPGDGLIPIPPTTTKPSGQEETTTEPITQPSTEPEEQPGNNGGSILDGIGNFFRSILGGIAKVIELILNFVYSFV
ncbi:MAG: hypothetical protein IJA02_08565 [Clostridia bacterium]|nr:hypothetical protein [Clostridia bacterium]